MPFDYTLGSDPPLVVIRGHGAVDSTMWLEALRRMLLDARFVPGIPILVDVTETKNGRGSGIMIARHCLHLIPRSRAAIFTRTPGTFGFPRQATASPEDRVRAFTTLTDAIEWLGLKPS
jgi:hypothetical protein